MKWISTKIKLPKEGRQVLCYGEEPKSIHGDGLPYKTGIYESGEWRSDHFCESSFVIVTHWMELPDAPQENK